MTNQTNLVSQSRSPFRSSGLTNLLYPSSDGMYRDQYRSGWMPSWFNQQWGGAQWGTEMTDGATGQTYKFTVATGNVQDDQSSPVGSATSMYMYGQGFKVSESMTLNSVWLKLSKVQATPALNINLTISIYTDSSGLPNLPISGATNTISWKLITSRLDGEWYRVSLGTPPALTPGVQYHIVVLTNNISDTDYVIWKRTLYSKYPYGLLSVSTNTPSWAGNIGYTSCFLIESSPTNSIIQPSGIFDQKLSFNEGTPINQSRSLTQPLSNFFDGKHFTYISTWTSLAKDKTFADFLYGLDHDRVVLRCNATTGYPSVTVYDVLGVARTITGAVDVSSGNHQVGVRIRALGDGQDVIDLIVDGAKTAGSLTGLTLNFDSAMREQGTAWVGGGFPVAPGWTQSMTFATLPSAQGWTWTGTATEANAMSVSGGKLFQNKSGYASTDTGYYVKANAGLSNATGWIVEWKGRCSSSSNTSGSPEFMVYVLDGTKVAALTICEYFIQSNGTGGIDFTYQGDFKSKEHTLILTGKGQDYYVYMDGLLIVDGTGKLSCQTTSNYIGLGDFSAVTGLNTDGIVSYIKYSTSGAILPQASTGSYLSEAAFWSGDKSGYSKDLYNLGGFTSVKQYCGVEKNYVGSGEEQKLNKRGVTISPTSTGGIIPDIDGFIFGSDIEAKLVCSLSSSGAGNSNVTYVTVDGAAAESMTITHAPAITYSFNMSGNFNFKKPLGLHKVEAKCGMGGGTITINGSSGSLNIRGKA